MYVGSEPAAIFRSLDGGETWEECAGFRAVPESGGWFFHAETRYSHVRDLRMAPHDPDRLYAGIEVGGVVRSHNGAESWQQSQGTDPDIHFINLSAAEPQRVYIATASGPYRSDDEGQRWELINDGLQRPYTLHITSAPDEADLVLVSVSSNAGRQNPQLYLSTNGGREWHLVEAIGSDDMVVAMDWDPGDSRRIYAATDGGGIFCSSDRGRHVGAVAGEPPHRRGGRAGGGVDVNNRHVSTRPVPLHKIASGDSAYEDWAEFWYTKG